MFFLQFLTGCFLVLILPGFLLHYLLFRENEQDLLEIIVYAFGASWVLAFLLAVANLLFKGNMLTAFTAQAILIIAMLVLAVRRVRAGGTAIFDSLRLTRSRQDWFLAAPLLILMVSVLSLAYQVEMPLFLGQEDCVNLVPAQRMVSLSEWRLDMFSMKPGDVTAYMVSPYSFIIALVSFVSGLETVQVYHKFRFFFSLISICGTYALARALFPQVREIAYITGLAVCVLIWQGWGTRYSAFVYSQFLPFTQYYDLTICVLSPVALTFFIRGLRGSWKDHLLCFFFTAGFFLVHAREGLVLIMIFSAITLFGLVQWRSALKVRGAILAIIGILAAALLVRYLQGRFVSEVVLQGSRDLSSYADRFWRNLLTKGDLLALFFPPVINDGGLNPSLAMFFTHPYSVLTALAFPFLVFLRRTFSLGLTALILLPGFIISFIPLATLLFIKFTYSQVLFGAPVILGMFPIIYIMLGLGVWLILYLGSNLIQNLAGPAKGLTMAGIGLLVLLIFPVLLHAPRLFFAARPQIFYAWLILGSIAALFLSFFIKKRPGLFKASLLDRPDFSKGTVMGLLALILIIIAWEPGPRYFQALAYDKNTQLKSLYTLYKEAQTRPSVADWEDYYAASSFRPVPWPVIECLRAEVPKGSIVAAPAENWTLYYLPTLTSAYVYTSGSFNSMIEEKFFDRLYQYRHGVSLKDLMRHNDDFRHAYLRGKNLGGVIQYPEGYQYFVAMVHFCDEMILKEPPIFNTFDSMEATLKLIDRFGIEYVLITPNWWEKLKTKFEDAQGFKKICEYKSHYVFKVSPVLSR